MKRIERYIRRNARRELRHDGLPQADPRRLAYALGAAVVFWHFDVCGYGEPDLRLSRFRRDA